MANRRLDISQFDAVGVYVVEIDASVPPIELDAQRTRIVVGFSKQGPKNTLVYLTSKRDAVNVFGNIDPYLERRGSYFHRSLLNALDAGPVFALNLLPIDEDNDDVDFISYSLDTESANGFKNEQGVKLGSLYSSFFNKQRFWRADEEYFNAVKENFQLSRGKYFSMVNLGNRPLTFLTRKSETAPRDFRITVSEYYGKGDEPLIAKSFDLMSDYFIDVIVLDGQWDDFTKLAADPIYGSYFDNEGLRKDRTNAFLASDGVRVVSRYTGSILPDVFDNSENSQSINALINRDFLQTGVFCALNDKAIEDYDSLISTEHIDLVGHNLIDGSINKIDYLSYNQVINNELVVTQQANRFEIEEGTLTNVTDNDLGFEITNYEVVENSLFKNLNIQGISVDIDDELDFENVYLDLGNDLWLYGEYDNGTVNGNLGEEDTGILRFEDKSYITETAIQMTVTGGTGTIEFNDDDLESFNSGIINKSWWGTTGALPLEIIYLYNENGELIKLDYASATIASTPASVGNDITITVNTIVDLVDGTHFAVIEPIEIQNVDLYANRIESEIFDGGELLVNGKYANEYTKLHNLITISNSTFSVNGGTAVKLDYEKDLDGSLFITTSATVSGEIFDGGFPITLTYSEGDKISTNYAIETLEEPNKFIVTQTIGNNLNPGDLLVATFDGEQVLTSISNKVSLVDETDGTITYRIETILPVVLSSGEVTKFKKIDNFVTHFNLHSLGGFTFTNFHLPNGTDSQMAKIYGVLENTNLSEILSDKNIIDWRYLVDTFSGGIAPNMGGKSILSKLAMNKKQGIALLNSPSMNEFAESTNPFFTTLPTASDPKPLINTDFIRDGGNLDLGPSNRFSIPNEENGGKYCGVFGPYLAISENNKRKIIPPAADISNNYMRKFRLGQPYEIVAGEPLGIIGNPNLIGVEYDLLNKDRANFEQIGINPIVFRDGVTKIFANLTGYQRVVSPLNSLHVRDLLISIENTLINITSKYLFRKNTPTVRLEIQTIVETYLESVQTDGGIDFFNVTIDSTNNTPDIIDQRIALLDIEIQPSLGMEKFVNRITVYGAAGADSTGF